MLKCSLRMSQQLTWEEIRKKFPETFVLLDHCEEQRVGERTILITKGEVILTDSDGKTIYDEYCQRGQPPTMTFGHTHWDHLEMEEVAFLGIRPSYG